MVDFTELPSHLNTNRAKRIFFLTLITILQCILCNCSSDNCDYYDFNISGAREHKIIETPNIFLDTVSLDTYNPPIDWQVSEKIYNHQLRALIEDTVIILNIPFRLPMNSYSIEVNLPLPDSAIIFPFNEIVEITHPYSHTHFIGKNYLLTINKLDTIEFFSNAQIAEVAKGENVQSIELRSYSISLKKGNESLKMRVEFIMTRISKYICEEGHGWMW